MSLYRDWQILGLSITVRMQTAGPGGQLTNAGNNLRNAVTNILRPDTLLGRNVPLPQVGSHHQHNIANATRLVGPRATNIPQMPPISIMVAPNTVDDGSDTHRFQASPSVVINLQSAELGPGGIGDINPTTPEINLQTGQAGQRNQPTQIGSIPSLSTAVKLLEGSLPFLILGLVKITYDHRIGILIFIAMYGTFHHANSSLRSLILRHDTSYSIEYAGSIAWISAFIVANIVFLYFAFADQKLYRSLYFMCPEVGNFNLWNMLWIVGTTDFVIKYATVLIKTLVAGLPRIIITSKKKGRYYQLIETISQFYRSLVPIAPWVYFLLDDEHGGHWFSLILLAAYIFCKGIDLLEKIKSLRKGMQKFGMNMTYGVSPNQAQLEPYDNCCPICQDKFSDPVMLSCNHIFCEECVITWFSRERTCPMCRANIVDDPQWRDGITSGNILLY